MAKVTIWHNPRCSKSRNSMTLLEEKGVDAEVVKYLDTPPTKEELKTLLSQLGMSARELMRIKEDIYKELQLKEVNDEEKLIDATKHLILKAPHPSPLSSYRGFFGSKPFSKSNEYLKANKKKEINWCLT
jgi:arsenate reductase